MRSRSITLTSLILLLACRTSKDVLLKHKIYRLERRNYTTYYQDQKICYKWTKLDKDNVLKVTINRRKRQISIVPKKKNIGFVYVSDVVDSVLTSSEKGNYLLVYDGVPYKEPYIDSLCIEKTVYKGFIVVHTIEQDDLLQAKSGKLIFYSPISFKGTD